MLTEAPDAMSGAYLIHMRYLFLLLFFVLYLIPRTIFKGSSDMKEIRDSYKQQKKELWERVYEAKKRL